MQTQHINHGDGTLAYSDYGGDGNPVLMRPGMGAMRSEYRFFPRVSVKLDSAR